jgi:broad specificity phosphatase PhoE
MSQRPIFTCLWTFRHRRWVSTPHHPQLRDENLTYLSESLSSRIHIIRHGQALHNVEHGYPHRDPPLTEAGQSATKHINLGLAANPDLVLISPMTRTIQTAINAFPFLLSNSPSLPDQERHKPRVEVQIWPSLREAHDAICNKCLSRASLSHKFPSFDFSECPEEWDSLPPHSVEAATKRAEDVRQRLKELSGKCRNIVVVTHRGFITFLVKGRRFETCERRAYRFMEGEGESESDEETRFGVNVETMLRQDYGPTVLVQVITEDSEDKVTRSPLSD